MKANEVLMEILFHLKVDRDTGAGAPDQAIAEALRRKEILVRSGTSGRDTGYGGVATALRDWLTQFEERDEHATEQITTARALREKEMRYAKDTLDGLQATVTNVQDNLERRIESNLEAISAALDTLNRSAPDGYGAKLDHKVQRPVEPDDSWIWSVVPMWRRSPGGRLLPYDNATNSAQEKLFSIHLVLAALLASPHPRGRVLILDELGDSLGEEHRRDVLSAVARVAQEYGLTVLGTCQDAVMPDASSFCSEILYFCYPSKAEALNLPTRMFGFDDNGERVELTASAILSGRPLT
jgi:transposase-like protein